MSLIYCPLRLPHGFFVNMGSGVQGPFIGVKTEKNVQGPKSNLDVMC